MNEVERSISRDYAQALADHLAGEGEAALHRAYEAGRRATAEGLSLLDMVSLHHDTLLRSLRGLAREQWPPVVAAAQTCLMETLSPFEMAQHEFREAILTLRRLNQMLEEEARRIAHALHDDARQLLVSVHLALAATEREHPATQRRLQGVSGLLDEVERHLRHLSHELRPPVLDGLGLVPAVEFLAQGISARTGVRIDVDGPGERRMPAPVETALYRVVQEALTNATRHGRPNQVRVSVRHEPGRVLCTVDDDGAGFEVAAAAGGGSSRGLGLTGMRERVCALGGHMTIRSAPGQGTELTVEIPLCAAEESSRATA